MSDDFLARHVTARLQDDRVMAQSAAERRVLARVVIRHALPHRLIAFNAADTHLHLIMACNKAAAGECARRIEIALRNALRIPVRFVPASNRPIFDQMHLVKSFFYVLRQHRRHGLASDPYHDSSILPDLLRMRVIGAQAAVNARALLPRIARSELLDVLQLDLAAPIRTHEPLLDAAAAAAGLPALQGSSRETIAARRAALEVAAKQLSPGAVAHLLGTSPRNCRRMGSAPYDPALVTAVELQLRARQTPLADAFGAPRARPPAASATQ